MNLFSHVSNLVTSLLLEPSSVWRASCTMASRSLAILILSESTNLRIPNQGTSLRCSIETKALPYLPVGAEYNDKSSCRHQLVCLVAAKINCLDPVLLQKGRVLRQGSGGWPGMPVSLEKLSQESHHSWTEVLLLALLDCMTKFLYSLCHFPL